MILKAGALALVLTGCGVSTPSADRIDLAPPPAALLEPCGRPVPVPETADTTGEQERLWGRDRLELVACGDEKAALAAWAQGVVGVLVDETT
ncbi:hypothetical protein [uncultured Maritimibacter sp.]|jgi:hypothetical protein|uniref:Rz1-like lysis system protein LysC n=1 Tax=uncultured Maritimibacter sp. TaxID=991866 RepID=UPI002630980F|nr:hypothetical protein [uncultured Maritimibacter sp.]